MRSLAATALCGALLLLAACGGDPQPVFSPTPSVSSSPSTAAPAGPPTMPSAAKQHTKAGAVAFVKYYWAVANYAQRTLDVAPLKALQDGHCHECLGGEHFISSVAGAQGRIEGGSTTVVSARATPIRSASGQWMSVNIQMRANAQVVDLPGRKRDKKYPGGHDSARFELKPTTGGWLIDLLDVS